MSTFEIIMAIINVAALIIVPIAAVFIGQKLQDRNQKRKDKMEIFRVLMMNRGIGWTADTVRALNIIDVVFSDDDSVRARWREYYNQLCIQTPNVMQRKQIQEAQDKLLEAIAQSLGYKKQVTWETIQNPYIPQGMLNAMQQQQNIQNGQEQLASAVEIFTKPLDLQILNQIVQRFSERRIPMPTLEWIGKSKVISHHQDVPFRVLERKYSFDENGQHGEDNGSENMIIRGDNLEALKALLPRYEGRVKCIYIDPPYNTGEEGWVYNDNVNDPKIKKWLGEVVGKEEKT